MAKKSTLPTQTSTLNKYFSKPGPSSATGSPSVGPSRSSSNRPTPSKRPRLSLEKEGKGDGMTAEQPVCLIDSSDEEEEEAAVARKVASGKAGEDRVEKDKGKGKVKEEAILIDLDDEEEEKLPGREKDKGKGKGRARQDEDGGDELGEFMAGVEVVSSVEGSDSTSHVYSSSCTDWEARHASLQTSPVLTLPATNSAPTPSQVAMPPPPLPSRQSSSFPRPPSASPSASISRDRSASVASSSAGLGDDEDADENELGGDDEELLDEEESGPDDGDTFDEDLLNGVEMLDGNDDDDDNRHSQDNSSSTPSKPALRPLSSLPPPSASPTPVLPNAFSRLMTASKTPTSAQEWQIVADDQSIKRGGRVIKKGERRKAPFFKVLTGMPVAVDAFRYGKVPGVNAYLLSHAHSDHYTALSKSWKHGPIYCSQTSANLIIRVLKVDAKWVKPLAFNVPTTLPNTNGVVCTMIEANHCPGSAIFLFEGRRTVNAGDSVFKAKGVGSSKIYRYLHCGDFRASPAHIRHPAILSKPLDEIYLDTTYLNPKYCFPPQPVVIASVSALAKSIVDGAPPPHHPASLKASKGEKNGGMVEG